MYVCKITNAEGERKLDCLSSSALKMAREVAQPGDTCVAVFDTRGDMRSLVHLSEDGKWVRGLFNPARNCRR